MVSSQTDALYKGIYSCTILSYVVKHDKTYAVIRLWDSNSITDAPLDTLTLRKKYS